MWPRSCPFPPGWAVFLKASRGDKRRALGPRPSPNARWRTSSNGPPCQPPDGRKICRIGLGQWWTLGCTRSGGCTFAKETFCQSGNLRGKTSNSWIGWALFHCFLQVGRWLIGSWNAAGTCPVSLRFPPPDMACPGGRRFPFVAVGCRWTRCRFEWPRVGESRSPHQIGGHRMLSTGKRCYHRSRQAEELHHLLRFYSLYFHFENAAVEKDLVTNSISFMLAFYHRGLIEKCEHLFKKRWEPCFEIATHIRVFIRDYWPRQVHRLKKDLELGLDYQIQNVRE